jgi:hypothetical protein
MLTQEIEEAAIMRTRRVGMDCRVKPGNDE